jgi:hypothetical protein
MSWERQGDGLRDHAAPPGLLEAALDRADRPSRRPVVLAAGLGLVVGLLAGGALFAAPPEAPAVATATPPSELPVRFVFVAPGARSVAVAGDWNGWQPEPLAAGVDGAFHLTRPLPRGEHEYMFVVDGTRWTADPAAPLGRDDGFGGRNSVLAM